MADIVNFYYKTGGAETGGTNALTGLVTGGSLISSGDAETNPLTAAALNTPYTVYYAARESTTDEDAGKDLSASFTVTAPSGWEVSATHGGTYDTTASLPAAVGAYKPAYIQQVGESAADPDLEVGTGGVTFTAGTRLAAPTLTLTTADGSVTATWDAVSGADGYRVQYKTHASATWLEYTADTSSPVTITGLTNTLEYDLRVGAYNEDGMGTWDEDTITVGYVWGDDFANGSINSTLWGVDDWNQSGAAIVEADGLLKPRTDADGSDTFVVWGKQPVSFASTGTLVVQTKVGIRTGGTNYGTYLVRDTEPDPTWAGDGTQTIPGKLVIACYMYNPNDATYPGKPVLRYYDNTNTARLWDASAGNWTTSGTTAAANATVSFSENDIATWKVQVDYANSRMRLIVTDGTDTMTSGWVTLSAVYGDGTNRYVYYNDASQAAFYPVNFADVKYYSGLV